MQHPKPVFSLSQADDLLPEDDIDELFGKLEPIEPPPALIARILSEVSRLSHVGPTEPEPSALPDELEITDPLVVRKEKQEPS